MRLDVRQKQAFSTRTMSMTSAWVSPLPAATAAAVATCEPRGCRTWCLTGRPALGASLRTRRRPGAHIAACAASAGAGTRRLVATELNEVHEVQTMVKDLVFRREQVGPGRSERWIVTRAPALDDGTRLEAAPLLRGMICEAAGAQDTAEIVLENTALDDEYALAIFCVLMQACCGALGFKNSRSSINTQALLSLLMERQGEREGNGSDVLGAAADGLVESDVGEMIDVVADNGTSILVLPRWLVRENRVLHRCVAILCRDRKSREIALLQRAAGSARAPAAWDVFVAGAVRGGEDETMAAIREISEELGVSDARIRKVDRCIVASPSVNCVVEVYIALGNFSDVQETRNPEEVLAVETVSREVLEARMADRKAFSFADEAIMVWERLVQLERAGIVQLNK
ncbi:putative Nudix hydrolase [Porphyridium purpureum]|uniref:Putative Nudix hydrolase n=1 Tax=Porphyridium purpureum TaxID=35688 RepID=A0A5J4Z618_PORPP|nr:putative Nudix hydrolase [Porphyridium purpureum]|eukprot:POR9710..scf295_1